LEKGKQSVQLNSRVQEMLNVLSAQSYDETDPNGMYTGRPRDTDETPVQDADDL